ncbi:hypothetical protein [Roseivirga sp. E12]|uniref:hypothetical protein n=1 Tax=Roseivirga sp. E12 TaxID=2819237 RepID=UPI001ABC86B5|nr:hypothetical protein [Roseivirga sp. E12]MBO3699512.1 hypothetical protein [Roseivirga sp. E12]
MSLRLIFLFFLLCQHISAQGLLNEEVFDVIYVYEEVFNGQNKELKRGSEILESELEKIRFTKESDILIVIGPTSGKKILRPYVKGKQPISSEWKFYGINVLQPIRKKTSSRDVFDDFYDFVRYTQFIRTDRVYIPSRAQNIKIGEEIESEVHVLNWKKGFFEIKTHGDSTIDLLSQKDEGWEPYAKLHFLQVKPKEFQQELRKIYQVLKKQNNNKQQAIDELIGYVELNYGYYPEVLIKKIVRFGN